MGNVLPNGPWEPRASAGARLHAEEWEPELSASGHLQHDFAGMFLDFRGGGLEPRGTRFCCALSLSSLEQLMASVRAAEANVLHSAGWKCGRELSALLLEAVSGYIVFSVTAVSEAPSLLVRTEVLSYSCAKTQARSGWRRWQSSRHWADTPQTRNPLETSPYLSV